MYYHSFKVVFQEVPGEISLCFSISGCTLRCKGCHSPFLWKKNSGSLLTLPLFESILKQYADLATCVLFMGGEWHKEELVALLKLSKKRNYKTCLYTGEDHVSRELITHLTWVKTGKWDQSLGGLENEKTNQKFIEVRTNTIQNYLFIKN
ncbi:anaerobic ribonucleoside-triphosphate reductase activating protein [Aquimarina sediminis]|uniref:anaerobic ribonucleoside-triphosphate reductase activating protein n=1 Tax=Aquimarina sediminis TaxID=2070536 RepID=UPI000CA0510E|nr:anaerobic ribonucleoside-triphosphate reductase activating protein [Aquimarina sediminis]